MGNHTSLTEKWITDEFELKRKLRGKNYLILDDILKFKVPNNENPIDPTHLGTLFMMDTSKEGKFYLVDILRFANLYSDKLAQNTGAVDFLKEFQGYCTLQMWNSVSTGNGESSFISWFTSLFFHDKVVYPEKYPDVPFVPKDAVKVLHEILQIGKTFGVDFIAFFDLMQRFSEEMKLMNLDDELLDDLVHLDALKLFAKEFIRGFTNYMTELDFDKGIVVP